MNKLSEKMRSGLLALVVLSYLAVAVGVAHAAGIGPPQFNIYNFDMTLSSITLQQNGLYSVNGNELTTSDAVFIVNGRIEGNLKVGDMATVTVTGSANYDQQTGTLYVDGATIRKAGLGPSAGFVYTGQTAVTIAVAGLLVVGTILYALRRQSK